MAFVLTGKDDWKQWSRDAIEAALDETDSDVHAKIKWSTDILVSSRLDTAKAKAAQALGCLIISYEELHHLIVVDGIYKNKITNVSGLNRRDLPIQGTQSSPKPIDMTPMHDLPGWGSF